MKKLWPAWLVALVWFGAVLIGVGIFGAAFSDNSSSYEAGQELGRKYGLLFLAVPVIAYIVQKVRIDGEIAKNPKR